MTAKGKLRQAIDDLSELEAAQTLAFIADRRHRDRVIEPFENAPEDDEPSPPEEDASVDEARAQYERGDAVSLDQLRNELG
jgi:hypothetical protein